MSAYSIALFFHLVGVLTLFAGVGLEQTGLRQLRNAASLAQVREWMMLLRRLRRFDAPAALTILVSGGYLAEHGAGHHAWVAAGIIGMVLMAVLGKQPAFPDAATSANWTMVGLCAHESAMKGGERVKIPVL